MRSKKFFNNLIILILILTSQSFSQIDSTKLNKNRMSLNPGFYAFQLEATTLFVIYEIGGQIDFDILSSKNNFFSLGPRISIEHYIIAEVGGTTGGNPFTDYNIFARFSIRGNIFWFSMLGGFSYHTTSEPSFYPSKVLIRSGFELNYHFIKNFVGITLKGSTSFRRRTGYLGIGLTFGLRNCQEISWTL